MDKKFIKGLVPAVFTPFDKDGEVDFSVITPYAERLISEGADGVFVCGTTGESPSMTILERKKVLEEWIKVVNGRIPVIAHVGGTCQKDCIELASHAKESGATAIASVPPFYFKPGSAEGLVEFFRPVSAAASGIPFYYYHIPCVTGVNPCTVSFLDKGAEAIPDLAGIKFTDTDFMAMTKCVNHQDGRFNILNGFDEMLLDGLASGAQGGVGSTYNYAFAIYRNIMDAWKEGNVQKARQWQQRSIDLVDVIIRHGGGVRGGKAVMKALGFDCGNCRRPFEPFTDAEIEEVKAELEAISFDTINNN